MYNFDQKNVKIETQFFPTMGQNSKGCDQKDKFHNAKQ